MIHVLVDSSERQLHADALFEPLIVNNVYPFQLLPFLTIERHAGFGPALIFADRSLGVDVGAWVKCRILGRIVEQPQARVPDVMSVSIIIVCGGGDCVFLPMRPRRKEGKPFPNALINRTSRVARVLGDWQELRCICSTAVHRWRCGINAVAARANVVLGQDMASIANGFV